MRSVLLVLFLLAGCSSSTTRLGGGGGNATVPPLAPGTNPPRWDHFCASVEFVDGDDDLKEIERLLDQASEHGWELVNTDGSFFCFKRPRS